MVSTAYKVADAAAAAQADHTASASLAGSIPAVAAAAGRGEAVVFAHAAADVDAERRFLPSLYTPCRARLHSHDSRSRSCLQIVKVNDACVVVPVPLVQKRRSDYKVN